jgi:hypothetical protein
MQTLYLKNLKVCSYSTAKYEFILHFETNDCRMIERYIGRPATKKHSSTEQLIRMDRLNGKVSRLEYSRTSHLEAKRGLIEDLGYATMNRGVFTLHHEKMSYFTKQASLDPVNQPLESKNPHKRISSIDDLCVQPQLGNIQQNSEHEGNGVITRKEEEESRPQTHKCVAPPVTTDLQLSIEETTLLHAKPTPEPDRGKIKWKTDEY